MTFGRVAEALPRAIRLVGWPKLVIFFFFFFFFLGFWFKTATEDRPAVCCLLQHFVTVCRPTGGMTAVPSREVTTSQVSAVTFGFYTEKEVLLLLKLRVRTAVPSRQSNCKLPARSVSHTACRNNSHRLTMSFANFVDPHRCAN